MSPRLLIENSPIATVITDPNRPDNPIIECNAPFIQLTGYKREEIIGRNCRFLSGFSTEAARIDQIRRAILAQRPVIQKVLNYRKDGSEFRNAVMIAPLFDDKGKLRYFLGSQVEIPIYEADDASLTEGVTSAIEKIQQLTARQREILIQLADGKLNKQIAFDLGLSERTIKMHRSALFRSLGVRSSAEAIRISIEAGH